MGHDEGPRADDDAVLRCFISWVHKDLDDLQWGSGPVKALAAALEGQLPQRLGGRGYTGVEVYLDLEQDRREGWAPRQDEAARRAHIFLPIVTLSYYEGSEECQKEAVAYLGEADLGSLRVGEDKRVIPMRAGPQPASPLPDQRVKYTTWAEYIASLTPLDFVLDSSNKSKWDSLLDSIATEIEEWDDAYGREALRRKSTDTIIASLRGISLARVHPWRKEEGLRLLWVSEHGKRMETNPDEAQGALPSVASPRGTSLVALTDKDAVIFRETEGTITEKRIPLPPSSPLKEPLPLAVDDTDPDSLRLLVQIDDDIWLMNENGPERRMVVPMPYAEAFAALSTNQDFLIWQGRWYVEQDCRWNAPRERLATSPVEALDAYCVEKSLLIASVHEHDKDNTGDRKPSVWVRKFDTTGSLIFSTSCDLPFRAQSAPKGVGANRRLTLSWVRQSPMPSNPELVVVCAGEEDVACFTLRERRLEQQ